MQDVGTLVEDLERRGVVFFLDQVRVVAPHLFHGVYRLGGDRHAPRLPGQPGVYLP